MGSQRVLKVCYFDEEVSINPNEIETNDQLYIKKSVQPLLYMEGLH